MYQKIFKVDESGIVGISILDTGDSNKSLEVGKRYVRSFSMACEPDDRQIQLLKGSYSASHPSQPSIGI